MPAYINRLLAIRDMVGSPLEYRVQEGFDLLSELLREFVQDIDFINGLEMLTEDFPEFKPKIEEMITQAQSGPSEIKPKSLIPKVFISYSHRDEKFKDELVIMLTPLRDQGILEIWQDRSIEEGDEWYHAIKDAMNSCNLALLLVSKNFLASRFIKGEELPYLLQRRKEQGLRIVPIILSACIWQSVPVLKNLQALPKDGKPVVSFKEETGERDEIWTEIAKAIENRAKSLKTDALPTLATENQNLLNAEDDKTPIKREKSGEKSKRAQVSILFLSADPTDVSRLRIGEEMREIQEKLQLAKHRGLFKLHLRTSVRPADISQAMLDIQPNIVYFSGHGLKTGALCFENKTGKAQLVSPEALQALFEQFSSDVNCVILNACYSEIQAQAISQHIDWVIGMNEVIGDEAAIAFAIGFYQALGAGKTIEEAYKLGVVQIRLQGIPEHLTPVLIKKE